MLIEIIFILHKDLNPNSYNFALLESFYWEFLIEDYHRQAKLRANVGFDSYSALFISLSFEN